MLTVEGLRAGYGPVEVLHGVSLDVRAGEILGVMAPNGAGKSTLFKALCGLCDVHAGRIAYADGAERHDITRWPTSTRVRKGIRYVPEKSEVFPDQAVRENLALARLAIGKPALTDALEQEIAAIFPVLSEKRHALAGTLSGGQKRMLSLAMALVQDPKVLLVDEPFAGLAPGIVASLIASLRAIRDLRIAVAVIDHNLSATLSFSDHILMLRLGKVVLDERGAAVSEERILQVFS